jgi:hypothetical protein
MSVEIFVAEPHGRDALLFGLTTPMTRVPDPFLKRRPLHVEPKVHTEARCFHEADGLGDQLLELDVGVDQVGLREPILEIPSQGIGVSQKSGPDSAGMVTSTPQFPGRKTSTSRAA